MTKRLRYLFGACMGLFVAAACGGGDGAPADKFSTPEKFCTEVAKEECQIAAKCVVPVADCQTARKASCMTATMAATVAPRQYRPSHAQPCIDKTRSVYAKTLITPTDLVDLNEVCSRVIQGEMKVNEDCKVDYDCEKALICDKLHCATRVVKKATEQCANFGEVCAAGVYCTMAGGAAYQCAAKKMMNETCDAATPCLEALRCGAGTCQARVGVGEACTSNGDCVKEAPFCDPYIGKKCDMGLSFSPGGAACAAYGGTGGVPDAAVDAPVGETAVPGDGGAG